jgi:large subunit ribosomal protein L47
MYSIIRRATQQIITSTRSLHVARPALGLEEFFPKSAGDDDNAAGRSWRTDELRNKSFTDLHKLWYVLLKERNMLLTLKQEAKIADQMMPGKERMRKVRLSMARVQVVISERERVRKETAFTETDKWLQLREEEGLSTMLNVPRKAAPNPDHSDQVDGVRRGGLARPGQPQRMMTKQERATFRAELAERRAEMAREEKSEAVTIAETFSDADLAAKVQDAEYVLNLGMAVKDLPLPLMAAETRGLPKILRTLTGKPAKD